MKLWNSCLLVAAESRNVIIASDDTPSASGVLLGNDAVTGISFLQLPASKRITAMHRIGWEVFI
jgi:hypothetical protein